MIPVLVCKYFFQDFILGLRKATICCNLLIEPNKYLLTFYIAPSGPKLSKACTPDADIFEMIEISIAIQRDI